MKNDPRYNAPPRLSDLPPDQLRKVLLARDEGRRVAYMRAFGPRAPRPSVGRRILNLFRRGPDPAPAASAACPSAASSIAPAVEAGRGASDFSKG